MEEERTLYQKIVLVILAAMIVVFGIVTAFNQSRKGILFRDSFLRLEEVTDADCFTGGNRMYGGNAGKTPVDYAEEPWCFAGGISTVFGAESIAV